jgi:hypothetical protein
LPLYHKNTGCVKGFLKNISNLGEKQKTYGEKRYSQSVYKQVYEANF